MSRALSAEPERWDSTSCGKPKLWNRRRPNEQVAWFQVRFVDIDYSSRPDEPPLGPSIASWPYRTSAKQCE